MLKYVTFGILIFVVLAIAFVPANLVKRGVESASPDIVLLDPQGTVWDGTARLLARGIELGQASWQTQILPTVTLTPTADWQLKQPNADLHGVASYDLDLVDVTAFGNAELTVLNDWLKIYDISLSGSAELDAVSARWRESTRQIERLDGNLAWSGGRVTYNLGGRLQSTELPPLTATLSTETSGPRVMVFEKDGSIPLIIVNQSSNGFVKIGLTKRFTRLLNTPWPGSDPDHAIVLEVEEQLL